MRYVLGIILLAVLGLMLFIRLAPTDPAQWHTALGAVEDADHPCDVVIEAVGDRDGRGSGRLDRRRGSGDGRRRDCR